MTTAQTTAWPEGVIARYLTVGGATVDVSAARYDDGGGVYGAGVCGGCPATFEDSRYIS